MSKMKKALGILASVLLWAVILIAALFTFITMATRDETHVASIAGYTPMAVQSDSMADTFYKGDMIFIKKCDPSSLQVGDIVCFHTIIENQYALNTHRIVDIQETNGYPTHTPRRATTTPYPTSTSSPTATSWASTPGRSASWAPLWISSAAPPGSCW